MATITEANDISTVLHYLLNEPRYGHGRPPTDDQAFEAAQRLADRAYKALAAGLHGQHVAEAWDGRRKAPNDTP